MLLVSLFAYVALAKEESSQRLASILELQAESNGIIPFDDETYKEYALLYPKPYHLFVLYTAEAKYCKVCPAYEKIFRVVVDAFPTGGDKPVVFGILNASKHPKALELHGMKHVPAISTFDQERSFLKKKNGALTIKPKDTFPILKQDPHPNELLDWVNVQIGGGSAVRLRVPLADKLAFAFQFASYLILFSAFAFWLAVQVRKRKWLLITIPLLLQYISTSGLFYNVIQGSMNLFGKDGSWILKSSRGQHLAEGLAMSACMSFTGLALLAAVKLPNSAIGKRMNADGVSIVMIVLAVIGSVMIAGVLDVYKLKTGWYQSPPFFPPSYYRRGPLMVDQGNSL